MITELCGLFALVGVVGEVGATRVAPECPLLPLCSNFTMCFFGLGTCMVHTRCCLLLDENLHHFSQDVHLLFYGAVFISSGGNWC